MNFSEENNSFAPEFHPLQTIPADLPTLAAEINAEHEAAERTARRAIDHAKIAGDKLLLAKPIYDPGNSPQRGNAFTYLGDRPNAFVARFKPFGLVMTLMEGQP